ncbi:hypothetical protein [Rufibacter psychrotolerans]|uniref:hypothetical protein n=1 Tax=Rufibacter psychrotolerans TaxID=2812556 RepID=UPI00196856CA|nr:hypothetical protein [Rufibacter sp. SYSU D00308]
MKTYLRTLAFAFVAMLFLTGCSLDNPQPTTNYNPILLKKVTTTQGDQREFLYSPTGWLTGIVGHGFLALNENEDSESEVIYDNWGRISYVLTEGPDLNTENAYFYTADNKLYKIDELINDQLESYHTFEYNTAGKLATRYSYFKTPASDEPTAANKSTFTYDANGNLSEHAMYHRAANGQAWELAQTMKYEGYDGKISVDHLTGFLFTPSIVLHKNNPGKVTITLASGEQRVTTFTYQYNEQNLPVKKTTTPSTGNAFDTVYTYQM